MSSLARLRGVFSRHSTWPWEGLARHEDLCDLIRHAAEFKQRLAFAYAVRASTSGTTAAGASTSGTTAAGASTGAAASQRGRYIGCVYIFPPTRQPGFAADACAATPSRARKPARVRHAAAACALPCAFETM